MSYLLQCIDKARDLLDAELTAMAGESYSRAYGVSAPFRQPKYSTPGSGALQSHFSQPSCAEDYATWTKLY